MPGRYLALVAHASGPLRAPQFDAHLDGNGVEMGPMHFSSVHALSKGTLAGAPIDVTLTGSAANLHASAIASFAPTPGLRDVAVTLEKGLHRVEARAAVARVAGGETRLDDVEVTGVGAPLHAALRQSPGALYVRAHSRLVDLAPIGELLGLEHASGRMRLDVDALLRANGAQGRMQIDIHDASFRNLGGVEAHLVATLDGRHVFGALTAEVAGVGKVDLHTTSLEIGGSDPPSWSYWKRAWGSADAEEAHRPREARPPPATGRDALRGRHRRRRRHGSLRPRLRWPTGRRGSTLSVRTTGLVLGDGSAAHPWRIEGLAEATGRVKVDGGTGR